MAYTPTNWQDGDIITANKLNKLEQGISDNEQATEGLKEDLNSEIARAESEEARIEALFTRPVEEAVSDWLDEHPEATTSVLDGSLTPLKMNSAFWDYVKIGGEVEIAKDLEQLRETKADYVYVISNDGVYGDGSSCWFWKHRNNYTDEYETVGGYTRNDGSVVFGMPNQCAIPAPSCPKTDVGEVIASYYQQNVLTYGNEQTLYNSTVASEIDCSSFVCAVLDGISYLRSRYVRGTSSSNLYGDYAGSRRTRGTGGDREALLTYQLAEWFAEHKRLFMIPNDKEGWGLLRFGDVLFSGSYDTAAEGVNNHYYGINHCTIVMDVFPNEGKVLVAQAGGSPGTIVQTTTRTVKFALINLADNIGHEFNVFARPAYGDGKDTGINISGLITTKGSVTADGSDGQQLANITLSKPMEAGHLYTITIKGTLPIYKTDGCWLYAKAVMTSRSSSDQYNLFRLYQLSGNGKETTYIGCLDFVNGTILGVIGLDIRLQSFDKIGIPSFEVKEVSVVEGIDFNAAGSKPLNFVIDDTEHFSLSKNESTISNGRYLIELAISKNTAITGDRDIGHFDGLYGTPVRGKTILGRRGNTDVVVLRITSDGHLLHAATSATGTYYITSEFIPSIFS